MLVALLAQSGPAWAVNRAIVFGGNCDGPTDRNSFLYNMATASSALSKNGWQVENLYSGASARCTLLHSDPKCSATPPSADCCPLGVDPQGWNVSIYAKIAGIAPEEIQVASKDNLVKALNDAQSLGPSDQLLILFETHGSPAVPAMLYGHGVCGDGSVSIGAQKFDSDAKPDPFYGALDQLKAKGVKMAIIDDSCYSGGSITDFGSYGCVLSAGTSNRPTTELPGSVALVDLLTSQDADQHSGLTPIASLDALELDHLDPASGSSHRLSMEELFVKSLFAGNSLLLSERLREIDGFSPGNAFAETLASQMIPSDPNGDEVDLYPDFNVNSSAAWSDPAAMNAVNLQVQELLGLIDGSVIYPPAATGDLSQELRIVATYTKDLENEAYPRFSPAFDTPLAQASIPADIRKHLSGYQDLAAQYVSEDQHLRDITARILESKFPIQFQFTGILAGAEDAFWKAFGSSSGSSARLTDSATGKITNVTLWTNVMNEVDLSPENLENWADGLVRMIASQMQTQGFQGINPDFKVALAHMLASSVQEGWSGIAPDQRAALKQLYQELESAQTAQFNVYSLLQDHDNFRTAVNLRIGQNQLFNFLNYRRFLLNNSATLEPARKEDLGQLKACSDFVLRDIQ